MLDDNCCHDPTFFYRITENCKLALIFLLRLKTIDRAMMTFGCSRVNYWRGRIFIVISLVFHFPPAYFVVLLLISISTWVYFCKIDLSTVSWNRIFPCLPLCSCLPSVENCILLFCFEDPLKTTASANLPSWLLWSVPIFPHPKHLIEHVRLHHSLDCLWKLSFYIHISLVSNKEDYTFIEVCTMHFFLPFSR